MESNWRFNVAALGMVGTNWLLAARLLPFSVFGYQYVVRTMDSPWLSFWYAFPGELPEFQGFWVDGGPRFPGPAEVEPD